MSADGLPQPAPLDAQGKRGWLRSNPWLVAAVVGVLVLTGMRFFSSRRLNDLPVLGDVAEFKLTDQDGEPFTRANLLGHVTLVSFIFTTCRTVCPAVTAANVDLQQRFAAAGAPVKLLTLTVDPEYDTPAVLKAYALEHGADLSRWTFATADRAALEKLIMGPDGFRLAMGDKTQDAAGVADITHSTKLVLVDRQARVRHYFSSGADERELAAAYAIDLLTRDEEGQ